MSPEYNESIRRAGLPGKGDWHQLATEPVHQYALNIVTTVRAGALEPLRKLLAEIDQAAVDEMSGCPETAASRVRFGKVTSLHYARWVILENCGLPRLAFSLHFDGAGRAHGCRATAIRNHLEEWIETNRAGLDAVYGHCEAYPGPGAPKEQVMEYLRRPEPGLGEPTFYCGSVGCSRNQIRQEADLRTAVGQWLDQANAAGTLESTHAGIRRQLVEALGPVPPFPAAKDEALLVKGVLAGAVIGYLLLWIFALPLAVVVTAVAAALFAVLRVKESRDPEFEPIFNEAENSRIQAMAANENRFFQNALSNVVAVKPGRFRLVLLKTVLAAIGFLARKVFVHGQLGQLSSIHFAHWYLLDDGKYLGFVSNFDSSWESYLGDFIDQASTGLTAVWSNTQLYPRTTALLFAGSRAGDRFKAWARHIQVPTQVWYSAYPDLSIVNINDNTLIRRGLADERAVPPAVWLAKVL